MNNYSPMCPPPASFRSAASKYGGKNEKDNLSKAERNELAELVKIVKDIYGEK
jgi:hypothetical protein